MPTVRKFLEKINIGGELAFDEPMAPHTSFRVGGPAEALVAPADRAELGRLLLAAGEEGIPCFVLGGGANILVGDRGIRGLVVDTRMLAAVSEESGPAGERLLVAEAGLAMDALCEEAASRGLQGLGSFAGMPGSVGGSAFMNARCYEVEMADRLAWVEWLRPGGSEAGPAAAAGATAGSGAGAISDGRDSLARAPAPSRIERRPILPAEWSYKRSPFQPGEPCAGGIVLGAAFRLSPGDPAAIRALMAEKRADREAKGHYRLPSAGSVFKNDRRLGRPTGKILDELGLRGRRIGGAMVSAWHANIIVNSGGARAADILALIELCREAARRELGVDIEPEVLLVGEF